MSPVNENNVTGATVNTIVLEAEELKKKRGFCVG